MKIAELADRAGIAPSAVRWYEQAGVLPAPARTRERLSRLRRRSTSPGCGSSSSLRRLGLAPEDAGRDRPPLPRAGRRRPRPRAAPRRATRGDRPPARTTSIVSRASSSTSSDHRGRRPRQPGRTAPMPPTRSASSSSARTTAPAARSPRRSSSDYGGADFEVFSAGTEANGSTRTRSAVLAEVGIDWSGARSKSIDRVPRPAVRLRDHGLRSGARRPAPSSRARTNTLHWGLDDPSEVEGTDEEKLAAFRRTETEISAGSARSSRWPSAPPVGRGGRSLA